MMSYKYYLCVLQVKVHRYIYRYRYRYRYGYVGTDMAISVISVIGKMHSKLPICIHHCQALRYLYTYYYYSKIAL